MQLLAGVADTSDRDAIEACAGPMSLWRRVHKYDNSFILRSMKIGERGQVTIPKDIRDRFGLGPETEVEFHVVKNDIVIKKAPRKLDLHRWKGHCQKSFAQLGYSSVDKFIDDVRGR